VREFGAVGCEGRGMGQTCIERFLWDRNTLWNLTQLFHLVCGKLRFQKKKLRLFLRSNYYYIIIIIILLLRNNLPRIMEWGFNPDLLLFGPFLCVNWKVINTLGL
jgi:hypothetical protein